MKRAIALLLGVIFWCFCGCTTFSPFDTGSASNLGEQRHQVETERQELPTPQLMLVETGLRIRPVRQRQPQAADGGSPGVPTETTAAPHRAASGRRAAGPDRALSAIDNAFERAQIAVPGRDAQLPVPPVFPSLPASTP